MSLNSCGFDWVGFQGWLVRALVRLSVRVLREWETTHPTHCSQVAARMLAPRHPCKKEADEGVAGCLQCLHHGAWHTRRGRERRREQTESGPGRRRNTGSQAHYSAHGYANKQLEIQNSAASLDILGTAGAQP